MTNEEALAYFIDNIEQIITTAKVKQKQQQKNIGYYEGSQIEMSI